MDLFHSLPNGSATTNKTLVLEDWKAYNEYRSISVLILFWEDSGHPGCQDGALQIGELFEKDFLYNVDYYAIPSINSHRRLDTKINTFFDEHEGPDHLMIIHYGGHGDPDDEHGQEKLAVWTA